MPITTGTVLGRYRLLEKAGVGGMSEVFRAEDETLKRIVAVKVIFGPVAADSTFRERFLREARLVAGLEHPNVLPVFDYGTATIDGEEVSYLVMPLVAGGSLKGRVAGPVPPALAITWLSAIAAALDHAHSKGILHRDVKPGNVLMDAQGRPLLADFGLARSAEVSSGLTATGTVLGTPLYMAPEQAMGAMLDGRADQYALAVIAFELLAGRVPFSAESPLAVLHQHVSTPPPPLSTVLPGTAASVDAALSRGLAKKPEDRFGSCSAFVAALGAALAVPGAAATVPQAVHGQSQVATIISAPALSPAALAAPASLAKDAPEGAPKGATRGVKVLLAALLLLSAGGGVVLFLRGTGPFASSSAPATATPVVFSSVKETPAPAAEAASTSAATPATSEISSKVNETPAAGTASTAGTAPPAAERRPQLPVEEKKIASRGTAGNSSREAPAVSRPKQTSFPPLLSGAAFSGDTQLAAAWESVDTRGRARLTREDFVSAMGTAREVLGRRPTAEARFLDAYTRAGVAYADGRIAEAWQLLTLALRSSGPAADTRVLRFVADEVRALGPNPGPDANWVMGLAFADVRGELGGELAKAEERAPRSPRVHEARALAGGR
jgi:eukaryotic-like serine/threonine-protein kinase